jgi:hypothetical protein
LGVPLGLLGGILLGAGKEENTGAVIELLASLSHLLDGARLFFEQLLGPREAVANPFLKQFLLLLDRLAGLVPHLIAFVAVAITKLGPLLVPLVAQMNAFLPLFQTAMKAIKFLIGDLFERLSLFLDPDRREAALHLLRSIIEQLSLLLPALMTTFTEFFQNTSDTFKKIYHGLVGKTSAEKPKGTRAGFKGFLETMGDWLEAAFKKSPLALIIDAAKNAFRAAGAAMSGPTTLNISGVNITIPSSSGPSTLPTPPPVKITSPADVIAALGGEPALGLGAIVPLARAEDFLKKVFGGQPIPLSAEAEAQLERFRHPPSMFEAERQRLKQALGGEPKEILAKQVAGQQQLRDLITGVVGRVLPPEIRPYLDRVGAAFASLDAMLLFRKEAEKTDFPVRDIPDNGKLLPVIHRLRVQSAGGNRLELQDFAARLAKAFEQDYPAPSVAES